MATGGPEPSPAWNRRPLGVSTASDPWRTKLRMNFSNSFSIRRPPSLVRNYAKNPEFTVDLGQASQPVHGIVTAKANVAFARGFHERARNLGALEPASPCAIDLARQFRP